MIYSKMMLMKCVHLLQKIYGETIWQHISDHYDWEDYLGKGGMRELEKSLKK